jgi:arginase
MKVKKLWIHFDADVLNDAVNPAVDYRLPGGLSFKQIEHILKNVLNTGRIAGISFTILNPSLFKGKQVAKKIVTLFRNLLTSKD